MQLLFSTLMSLTFLSITHRDNNLNIKCALRFWKSYNHILHNRRFMNQARRARQSVRRVRRVEEKNKAFNYLFSSSLLTLRANCCIRLEWLIKRLLCAHVMRPTWSAVSPCTGDCWVLLHLHGLQMSNLLRCKVMPYLLVDTMSTSHQVCVPSVCVQPLDHTALLGVVHMLRVSFYFPLQTALAAPQNDPCDCERWTHF